MVKFFSKIRHQLWNQRQFSRYLFYAIGEILLVVIGILIALQVNTWNQERSMRVKEQFYLAELLIDFRSNKIEAMEKYQFANNQTANVDLLLASIDNPDKEVNDTQWFTALNHAWFLPHPVFEKNMWENLHSTGDLAIIRNTDLIKNIGIFYRHIEALSRLENEWGDFHLSYRNKVNEILDQNLRQSIFEQIIAGENEWESPVKAQPFILKLKAVPGVKGILSDIRINRAASIKSYQAVVDDDDSAAIIVQLEQELGLEKN